MPKFPAKYNPYKRSNRRGHGDPAEEATSGSFSDAFSGAVPISGARNGSHGGGGSGPGFGDEMSRSGSLIVQASSTAAVAAGDVSGFSRAVDDSVLSPRRKSSLWKRTTGRTVGSAAAAGNSVESSNSIGIGTLGVAHHASRNGTFVRGGVGGDDTIQGANLEAVDALNSNDSSSDSSSSSISSSADAEARDTGRIRRRDVGDEAAGGGRSNGGGGGGGVWSAWGGMYNKDWRVVGRSVAAVAVAAATESKPGVAAQLMQGVSDGREEHGFTVRSASPSNDNDQVKFWEGGQVLRKGLMPSILALFMRLLVSFSFAALFRGASSVRRVD